MKLFALAAALGALTGEVTAWGSLGHVTTAYLASHFVSNKTEAFFQDLLRNPEDDYLAKVATWADTIRYTRWGHFTGVFHFIDAKDDPPSYCGIDLERDCKAAGCVVTALANYTERALDPSLNGWERNQAARFVVHFVGDLHQPLHNEDVQRGGNGIHVLWEGREFNLHHVWDSSIAERLIGGAKSKPYDNAKRWAEELKGELREGKFSKLKDEWLESLDFDDQEGTALAWAREGNAYVCSHVLPEGPVEIEGKELGGDYYEKAAPVVELQVARAGYRMAAWLDQIAERFGRELEKTHEKETKSPSTQTQGDTWEEDDL